MLLECRTSGVARVPFIQCCSSAGYPLLLKCRISGVSESGFCPESHPVLCFVLDGTWDIRGASFAAAYDSGKKTVINYYNTGCDQLLIDLEFISVIPNERMFNI